MSLQIRKFGDPVLREKAELVEAVTDDTRQLADEMLKAMYADKGIGLAAEQVGRTEHMCIIDIPEVGDLDADGQRFNPDVAMPLVLINAEIVDSSPETEVQEEGCLSFPGIYVPVTRPSEVTVRYLDRNGDKQEIHSVALLARAIQHELDHLNGVLLVDRMSVVKKISLSGRLKRLKKETQADLKLRAG
jgi:peptide deformylase